MALIRRNQNQDVARERRRGDVFVDPFSMVDALLRWDPFRNLEAPLAAMAEFVPSFDVRETKDAYLLKADLPGLREGDIDISVTGNVVTISGRREQEQRNEGERYFSVERSYGTFSRSFSLPDGADTDNIQADLREGVLTLHIPKRPEVQPRRISLGGAGEAKGNGGAAPAAGQAPREAAEQAGAQGKEAGAQGKEAGAQGKEAGAQGKEAGKGQAKGS